MLRPNLEALARRDPELVQRIGWPVESDHVVLEESGEVVYRLHQGRYRLNLSDEAVTRALPAAAPQGSLRVGRERLMPALVPQGPRGGPHAFYRRRHPRNPALRSRLRA